MPQNVTFIKARLCNPHNQVLKNKKGSKSLIGFTMQPELQCMGRFEVGEENSQLVYLSAQDGAEKDVLSY
jgi:hypothetical protein